MKTRKMPYCEITVRRPNGELETLRHPKVTVMTPVLWKQFCQAMAKAGKGEGISYNNLTEDMPLTLAEQREELTNALSAAMDSADAAMRNAQAKSISGDDLASASEAVKKAEADIAEFDTAHPEIVAAMESKRAETANQHLWD